MHRKNKEPNHWVLIPAAGIGRRMRSKVAKQYLQLQGKPILEHTLSLFISHPKVKKIIVILHEDDQQWPKLSVSHHEKLQTVKGGKTRADSVMQGLQFLETFAAPNDCDWVLVHDALRPCLLPEVLHRLLAQVETHPIGGLLALPIAETLKKLDAEQCVIQTIPRQDLWMAQTPQMFRYHLLQKAMREAARKKIHMTDEASAIECLGMRPLVVKGDRRNIKITWPQDLVWAEKILLESTTVCK